MKNVLVIVVLPKSTTLNGVSKYILKYIKKDILSTSLDLGIHTYYCSHGLKRATNIFRGFIYGDIKYDFQNDYVMQKNFSSYKEIVEFFENHHYQEVKS